MTGPPTPFTEALATALLPARFDRCKTEISPKKMPGAAAAAARQNSTGLMMNISDREHGRNQTEPPVEEDPRRSPRLIEREFEQRGPSLGDLLQEWGVVYEECETDKPEKYDCRLRLALPHHDLYIDVASSRAEGDEGNLSLVFGPGDLFEARDPASARTSGSIADQLLKLAADDRSLNKFELLAALFHGGNRHQCAELLRLQGFEKPPAVLDAKSSPSRANGRPANGHRVPGEAKAETSLLPFEQTPWPKPLDVKAFQGLAGDVVWTIEPETESDQAAILLQFLVAFGSAAGRHAYFLAEGRRRFLNIYLVLVGRTAKRGGGASLGWIEDLFRSADPSWVSRCVQAGLSSGEWLIWAVRDEVKQRKPVKGKDYQDVVVDGGVADKRLLVIEEFSSVLQASARRGNTLSAVIRQAWESGRLCTMIKKSPARATDAHVSIIGHITQGELIKLLNETEAGNGFAGCFLWCCVRRSKLLPDGGQKPDLTKLQQRLHRALTFARLAPQLALNPEAAELWHGFYKHLAEESPGLVGLVTNRAEAQVLRLGGLYALLDESKDIRAEHLLAAMAVWKYAERSARCIFGHSTGNASADLIFGALLNSPNGLTSAAISDLFDRNRAAGEIKKALAMLNESGLIESQQAKTGGRPATVWKLRGYEINEKNEKSHQATTYRNGTR